MTPLGHRYRSPHRTPPLPSTQPALFACARVVVQPRAPTGLFVNPAVCGRAALCVGSNLSCVEAMRREWLRVSTVYVTWRVCGVVFAVAVGVGVRARSQPLHLPRRHRHSPSPIVLRFATLRSSLTR